MKAAIYTRVSTNSQVEEGYSLEAQFDRLKQYVRTNEWDLVRVYTDPGVSAKDLNRPGVQEMLNNLKDGMFQALIVHKLDRLTRNIGDLYDLVELINKHEVKLISLSENIDTSTPMGRLFIYILGIFAQMYRENLREEVKKGLTKRAELGLRNAFAPYGYVMNEEGGLEIVPEQAKLIREIFNLLITKKWGYLTIAKYLNERKISGLRGGIFHSSSIETILKNHTYNGKNHWKPKDAPESERIIGDGVHEPIIDDETFEKAQTIIQRRSRKEMSRSSYDYPYSSIIRCGKCGGPYHGCMQPNNKKYKNYYYRCFNKLHGTCDQSAISEIKFEKLFFEHLQMLRDGLAVQEIAASNQVDENAQNRKRIERELTKSETRRKNWQYAFGDGKMPYEDYVKLMDEEMVRVSQLEEELKELPPMPEKPIGITMSQAEVIDTILGLKENWDLLERTTKKDFINTMFTRITIEKNGKEWSIIDIE